MRTRMLIDEVQLLLETINEQVEIISRYEEKIPDIELDILLDNVKKIYTNLQMIIRTNGQGQVPEQGTTFMATSPSSVPVPGHPEHPFENPDLRLEKPVKQPEKEIRLFKNPARSGKTGRTQGPDLFSDRTSEFSEKLQEARQQNIPKPRKSKSNDLKSMITINEKFLFINELFDGNLGEYNENIEALGRFQELNQAMDHLDLLRKKNLWNSESVAFVKLKELVEKRFG